MYNHNSSSSKYKTVYFIYFKTLELGFFISQSSRKSSKDSFLTIPTKEILLLLVQQTHMKEKHERSEIFISFKY